MTALANIERGLNGIAEKSRDRTCVDADNQWCVTFGFRERDTRGEPFWLQVNGATLNLQYLDDDEPSARLASEVSGFPKDFRQIDWDRSLYATFEIPVAFAPGLAQLIDRIARE